MISIGYVNMWFDAILINMERTTYDVSTTSRPHPSLKQCCTIKWVKILSEGSISSSKTQVFTRFLYNIHAACMVWNFFLILCQINWYPMWYLKSKRVNLFVQCTKMQLITSQNFNIQTCFSQFLWFFGLTLFLPAKGRISPYMSVTWPSPVE